MKTQLRIKFRAANRAIYGLFALMLLATVVVPAFGSHASAAGAQLQSRSIKLSDSGASSNGIASGVGSGTAVTYRVKFNVATVAHSVVIDFCQDSPIIGDTSCVAPAGMDLTGAALAAVPTGGPINPAGGAWTGVGYNTGTPAGSSNQHFSLHDDGSHSIGPADTTGGSTSGVEEFDITGIVNPSTVGTFYARIYTFTSNIFDSDNNPGSTADNYNGATSPGTYLDYGGIAMTTTQTITISARVQEALTFCVTSADPSTWTNASPTLGHSCADPVVGSNLPALTIGTGSPTKVLSATAVDTGNVYTQLSTNATNGAIIRIRNSNTPNCGGLSANGGTSCAIAPAHITGGAGAIQAGATSGVSAFAMFASYGADDPGTGGGPTFNSVNSSSCVADPAFNSRVANPTPSHEKADPNHSADTDTWYGMPYDNTNATGVTSTFGATVVACSQPVYRVDNYYQFAVTPTLSTPAGIYKANLSMIATATF